MNRIRKFNKVINFDHPRVISLKYLVKQIIYPFIDLTYTILYRLMPRQKRHSVKYNIAICAIFRNESSSLKEWIEYHLLLGVEHFYMYNNFSTDNYRDILEPYILKGIVSLIDWEVEKGQFSAYMHWYDTFRNETQWVSFLDLDEFICPVEDDNIKDWLDKMNRYPVVQMYWKMFTSSGLLQHDFNRLNIEQYVVSADKLVDIGKVFYNTSFDIYQPHIGMMHSFLVKWRNIVLFPVNQWGHITWKGISHFKSDVKIQVNHYWGRAFDLYMIKKKRGSATGMFSKSFEHYIGMECLARTADYRIFKYLIRLKLKMADEELS